MSAISDHQTQPNYLRVKQGGCMRLLILLLLALPLTSTASDLKVVTWNVKEIFRVDDVTERKQDFVNLYQDLNPDILILQEITSCAQLERIKEVIKKPDYHIVCSDFNPDNTGRFKSLELGIVSKFKIDDAIEYDQTLDDGDDSFAAESQLAPSPKLHISEESVSRGFLWARIDEAKVVINVVHLKSSRGKNGTRDKSNARKREYVISSVANSVIEDTNSLPGYTYIVAGDFNVGHSDNKKNGFDLSRDCFSQCGDSDLYDETHAILASGLIPNLEMRNLTFNHKGSTFPRFPGSPIDNIYVSGKLTSNFSDAQIANKTYGSDHLPVLTVASNDTQQPVTTTNSPEGNPNGLKGKELRIWLKENWFDGKHHKLGYNTARQLMYSNFDKNDEGEVVGVYTGFTQKAKKTTFLNPINAEHTVPQSWFSKREPMKSDVHHLFPTHKDANSLRSSLPFGDIDNPSSWVGSKNNQYDRTPNEPNSNSDEYSEYVKGRMFEPAEAHKGNVARAIAYFYTMYPNKAGNIKKSVANDDLSLLTKWHIEDPVDDAERERNRRIAEEQGNLNPYIEQPELLCEAWDFPSC